MNLSRYYKSSSAFQPEEIVKQDDNKASGWSPLVRNDDKPLTSGQFQADQDVSVKPVIKQVSQPPPPPSPPTGNAAASPAAEKKNPPAAPKPPEKIDLSKYCELAVAERQSKEAYRQGVEQGHQEGYDKADQDFGSAARALLLACRQLDTLRETIIANSSSELFDFAMAVAERIVRISVQEQDTTIVATIEEALRRAVKSDEFSIFIHPDDYDAVSARTAEIIAGISGLNSVVLRKDKTLERGGAKIESDNCTIDATIASQFELIREEVKKNHGPRRCSD